MQPPRSLNYARRSPQRVKRTFQRLAPIVVLSLLGAFICWTIWAGYLRERIAVSLLWHRAENFSEPPATIVFTTDPKLVPGLIRTGYASQYRAATSDREASRHAAVWIELQSTFNGGIFYFSCPFLHWRSVGGQSSRIVAVQAGIDESSSDHLRVRIWPETLAWSWPPPRHIPSDWFDLTTGLTVIATKDGPFTLYAGQADPTDSSHFTIGYATAGRPGTIDGWLGSNGIVKLTIRDGPLARRPVAK